MLKYVTTAYRNVVVTELALIKVPPTVNTKQGIGGDCRTAACLQCTSSSPAEAIYPFFSISVTIYISVSMSIFYLSLYFFVDCYFEFSP